MVHSLPTVSTKPVNMVAGVWIVSRVRTWMFGARVYLGR